MKKTILTAAVAAFVLTAQAGTQTDSLTVQEYRDLIPTFRYTVTGPEADSLRLHLGRLADLYSPDSTFVWGDPVESYHNGHTYQFQAGKDTLVYNPSHKRIAFIEKDSRKGKIFYRLSLDRKDRKVFRHVNKDLQKVHKRRPRGEKKWAGKLKLDQHGVCLVRWYDHGAVTRYKEYLTLDVLPELERFLHSDCVDQTGRVTESRHRFIKKDSTSIYYQGRLHELKKANCIEILFPEGNLIEGLVITIGKYGKVYGLDRQLLDEPYLYYNDNYDTRILDRWLRKNHETPTGNKHFNK